jgi:hypothetical protein
MILLNNKKEMHNNMLTKYNL